MSQHGAIVAVRLEIMTIKCLVQHLTSDRLLITTISKPVRSSPAAGWEIIDLTVEHLRKMKSSLLYSSKAHFAAQCVGIHMHMCTHLCTHFCTHTLFWYVSIQKHGVLSLLIRVCSQGLSWIARTHL
jgi:hypothetical protein